MSDYPDPDEEYELMYADEFELLRETEEQPEVQDIKNLQAKRSLNFSTNPTAPILSSVTENISGIELLPSSQSFQSSQNSEAAINGHKRTVDDLFGDIGDIDFDSILLPSKRQKTEEEEDFELINKIIGIRKSKHSHLESKSDKGPVNNSNYNRNECLSADIPRWPFIPVTNSEGDRVYVKLDSEDYWELSLDVVPDRTSWFSCHSNIWKEARKILEKKEKEAETQLIETQPAIPDDPGNTELWVDKYKPHSYLDLLSEEPVNRALLHWLHLWDKVVFKKEVHIKDPQQRNSFSKRAGKFQMSNKWRGKKDSEPELDDDGRPHHKVALLCGPPGVGKTTLAHLLATLAGYRPVELNASDERSTEAFQTALQSATLMKSVLDAEKRPNCLILDEIDGAPLPTVELLVKWCTATQDGGKKKKTHPLRRPVIAICNELYSPALRPLRPISLVLQVPGVAVARLSARLSHVAATEGVRAAPRALSELATRARGDLRAAIHLLCFIKAKEKEQLTVEDVQNSAFGTKDCGVNVIQALHSVFTLDDQDYFKVVNDIQACGEYERITDGIFENYLTARVDSRMLIASETLSWLRLYDETNSWTQRTQNYCLYGFLSMYLAACHRVLATRNPPKLKFPSAGHEAYRRRMEIDGILQSVKCCGSRRVLRLDILPLLPYILAPTLRSPNVQLCSESERATLRSCAGAMCDYGLEYVQRRSLDGLYTHVLEPDIHKVAFFGTEEKIRLSPAVRQAIAQEHQLEVIRRNEEMMNKTSSKKVSAKISDQIERKLTKVDTGASDNTKNAILRVIPNHLQTLTPKAITKAKPQVHKDFFGRVVPISQAQKPSSTQDVITSSGVYYQYREGYNNAVRRAVRMRDLL